MVRETGAHMRRSSFYMWGERGIIGTFFADMYMWASARDWQVLLESISIRDPRFPRCLDGMTVIVEPDFGNKGFGHPDAVLLLENNSEQFVVIAEAKRKQFAQSCGKSRGQQYYNSTLKGQLELNHILAVALSEYLCANTPLTEPDWIADSPYMTGRFQGRRATLKNEVVLRSLVSKISGLPMANYFHLVITTDQENPFENPLLGKILPEIYQAAAPRENAWTIAQAKYGWLNYDHLHNVSGNLDRSGAPIHAGLFEGSYAINLPNMATSVGPALSPRAKKSILVYVPEINARTFLHCSYQGMRCKLRDYMQSSTVEPIPDKRFTRAEVLDKARWVIAAQPVPYTNVVFWYGEIKRLNLTLNPLS